MGLMGEGGGEGKHWMLCGAVVVSRGGCCHMKGLCKARGERKGEEQERERERDWGDERNVWIALGCLFSRVQSLLAGVFFCSC